MTTIFKQLEKLQPVAEGGFSELYVMAGNAVKLIEDQDYLGVLEESYKQNIAAESGLAPKVHAVAKQGEKVVVVMDMVDDETWYHPHTLPGQAPTLLGELEETEMEIGLKLYCKMLKAGVLHADFHSGNWFINDDGEGLAIDFGLSAELHEASDKYIKRAVQFILPALQTLGYDDHAEDLVEAWANGIESTRIELANIAGYLA